jgi:hypothetical protein
MCDFRAMIILLYDNLGDYINNILIQEFILGYRITISGTEIFERRWIRSNHYICLKIEYQLLS